MTTDLAILDFDGTLCSTRKAIGGCIDLTFDAFGWPRPSADAVQTAIGSGGVIADVFGGLCDHRLTPADIAAWAQRYRTIYDGGEGLARTTLFPGVREGLDGLLAAGCRAVVLSNKGQKAILQALEHFGLSRHIEQVFGDAPGVPRKPDPASWSALIVPAYPTLVTDRAIMVGDTVTDLLYARNIGATACWARYGFGEIAACEAMIPDIILDSFAELPGAIARRK